MASPGAGTSFCDLHEWAKGLSYISTAGGEELVDAKGGIIMLECDRDLVQRAVCDLHITPEHSVLEIGFGCGYSADTIQARKPASHVIVECAPAVLQRLRVWAQDRPSVTIVEGSWQASLPQLGKFDRIFFDAEQKQKRELDAKEMDQCSNEQYRREYAEALCLPGASVYEAFEQLVRSRHSHPGALISNGEGTEFRQWTNGFFFSHDSEGKQQLLDADGMQIMMEWERPYMKECVDVLCIDATVDVLEVGFGCGYSADYIQQKGPRSHTIIECAGAVIERLRVWAADKPSVKIVEGTWQARLPDLGAFDCIFFDDYGIPGRADREMERCCKSEYRDVYHDMLNLHGGTHFEGFLTMALKWHLHQGGRLSGFVMHEIPQLREDGVEVRYREMEVSPPQHCNYFFSQKAIIPLFVKTGQAGSEQDSTSAGSRRSSPAVSRSRSRSRSARRVAESVRLAPELV